MKSIKPGKRSICSRCGTGIEYSIGGYWQHLATNPRHPGVPMNDENEQDVNGDQDKDSSGYTLCE